MVPLVIYTPQTSLEKTGPLPIIDCATGWVWIEMTYQQRPAKGTDLFPFFKAGIHVPLYRNVCVCVCGGSCGSWVANRLLGS